MNLIETKCLYTNADSDALIEAGLEVPMEDLDEGLICFDVEKMESFNPSSNPNYTKVVLQNDTFNICMPYKKFKSFLEAEGFVNFIAKT